MFSLGCGFYGFSLSIIINIVNVNINSVNINNVNIADVNINNVNINNVNIANVNIADDNVDKIWNSKAHILELNSNWIEALA